MISGVLVIIAHPDDEVFVSGTICLLSAKGFAVDILCLTNGEGGDADGSDYTREALGKKRAEELRASAAALGIRRVDFIGMPDALIPAEVWDTTKLLAALSTAIKERKPSLILTHGRLGGYGHPAHRLTHSCVMLAAKDYPGSIFTFCGKVPGAFFTWHMDEPSTLLVDVRDFRTQRAQSLRSHVSQLDYFLQPYPPRSFRKHLSALWGRAFSFWDAGRKRIPVGSADRFISLMPFEGLVVQKPLDHSDFFSQWLPNDHRVRSLR